MQRVINQVCSQLPVNLAAVAVRQQYVARTGLQQWGDHFRQCVSTRHDNSGLPASNASVSCCWAGTVYRAELFGHLGKGGCWRGSRGKKLLSGIRLWHDEQGRTSVEYTWEEGISGGL